MPKLSKYFSGYKETHEKEFEPQQFYALVECTYYKNKTFQIHFHKQ